MNILAKTSALFRRFLGEASVELLQRVEIVLHGALSSYFRHYCVYGGYADDVACFPVLMDYSFMHFLFSFCFVASRHRLAVVCKYVVIFIRKANAWL
jgi:hypothetical protein